MARHRTLQVVTRLSRQQDRIHDGQPANTPFAHRVIICDITPRHPRHTASSTSARDKLTSVKVTPSTLPPRSPYSFPAVPSDCTANPVWFLAVWAMPPPELSPGRSSTTSELGCDDDPPPTPLVPPGLAANADAAAALAHGWCREKVDNRV